MNEMPTPGELATRGASDTDTGEAEEAIKSALGQLDGLEDVPVVEHVAVFESVQQELAEVLHSVDES
ncbi:hypothetical protein [Natronoglycomyces albus]|uniref:Uncharacterized protein n=1 Tax=Natronoglycomyces albus TaxID=2811108 RepID=A0A895XF27_9ACTN|nr:hypothetical protein [Natronoglycomyces albus]QSB03924.1 hypothetical protein JQS30_08805 [Natronoglycomyces albus]